MFKHGTREERPAGPPLLKLLRFVEFRELLAEVLYLGSIIHHDVRIVGMLRGVILVIVFGGVEGGIGIQLRYDRGAEDFGLIELIDVGLGDLLLIFRGVKNCGAVLRAVVGALAIQFRGIVCHRKKDAQELAESDFGRIVDYFHGFGVAGVATPYGFVVGALRGAACVARSGGSNAFHVLEDGLDSPEAAAREHDGLLAGRGGQRIIERWSGKRCGAGLRAIARKEVGQRAEYK